jgi:superfamily II DNA or RNA helicase
LTWIRKSQLSVMALIDDYSAFLTSFESTKFKALRSAQEHLLEKYGAFETTEDLGIELPTGAGKTLIALLIAEAKCRNDSKIAVLSANKILARQMYRLL